MIPWGWVAGSAWAGGVTSAMLSYVFIARVTQKNFSIPSPLFLVLWPFVYPAIILLSDRFRSNMGSGNRQIFEALSSGLVADDTIVENYRRDNAARVFRVFEACDTCKKILHAPREMSRPPARCETCETRLRAWQDEEVAKQQALFAQLCEPCRKGLGIE